MKFTYIDYIASIKEAGKLGFRLSKFDDKDHGLKMYLRHDVDTSIEKAYELAKREYENGIQSTYYILLTSDFYNIFNTENIDHIKKIISYGHDIGIHFDYVKYKDNQRSIEENIRFERNIFETFFHIQIKSFSLHRPIPAYVGKDLKVDDLIYAYSPALIEYTEYISDSRMHWRNDFDSKIRSCKKLNKDIQVLTHAFWYSENEKTMRETCLNEFSIQAKDLYISFQNQVRDFSEILDKKEFEKFQKGKTI